MVPETLRTKVNELASAKEAVAVARALVDVLEREVSDLAVEYHVIDGMPTQKCTSKEFVCDGRVVTIGKGQRGNINVFLEDASTLPAH